MDDQAFLRTIDFNRLHRAVVAISGGSDSTALLLLIKDRIGKTDAATKLLAVTVDHGLRDAAAAEARQVADLCASIGVPHKILKWKQGHSVKSGIAARGRAARYRLLGKAADDFGAEVIFTGHTLDDQVETVAMRLERGSGRGLAGIAPLTLYDSHVWIARPLLVARREELRRYLQDREVDWIDDPSNVDTRSERVRVRKMLAKQPPEYSVGLLADQRKEADRRLALGQKAAGLIAEHARQIMPGLIEIGARRFADDREAATIALRALIAVMGGKTQFPDNSRAEVLAKNLAAGNWRGSLGGCVIERLGDVIYIWREYRGAGPKPVDASSGAIWDGRWRLKPQAATPESRIVALGRDGELAPCREEIGLPRRIRRAASAALPVLVTGGEADKDKPAKFDPGPFLQVLAPWREFLPCFDLDLAMSMEKLLCGEGLPEIPVGLKKLLPI